MESSRRFVSVCLAVGFVAAAAAQSVPELQRYRVLSIPDEVARLGGLYGPSASGEYLWQRLAGQTTRPVYWSPARGLVDLSPWFPSGQVQVWDVNNLGQCVGFWYPTPGVGQPVAFVFDTGFPTNRPRTFSVLPTPPGSLQLRDVTDVQINDTEQVAIAGRYDDMPVPNDHWGADLQQLNNLGTLFASTVPFPVGSALRPSRCSSRDHHALRCQVR